MQIIDNTLIGDALLKGYYRFEDNSNATIVGPNGTPTDMAYGAGKYAKAAQFNGTSSQINLGATVNLGSKSWSIVWWAKRTNTTGDCTIIGQGDAATLQQVVITSLSGNTKLSIRFFDSASDFDSAAGVYPADSAYHQYVVTFNNSDKVCKIYKDGAFVEQKTMGNNPTIDADDDLTIGAIRNQNFNKYDIDDLGVFFKVLSVDEISSLYMESSNGVLAMGRL